MFDVIISSLLPVIIIISLGFLAGYRHDFNKDQASIFNELVLSYALPIYLFCAIVTIPVDEITQQIDLAIGLFFGMILLYVIVFCIIHFLFKQDLGIAALLTITITCPSAAYVGIPIMSVLEGTSASSISVTIVSLFKNIFQMPITIILLISMSSIKKSESKLKFMSRNIVSAINQPLVWAPILALTFAMFRIDFPTPILSAFDLLGKATVGVALFAIGIILYSYKIKISLPVVLTIMSKNIFLPFVVWGAAIMFGFPFSAIKEIVLVVALPTASAAVILAIKYQKSQQIVVTAFFLSTVLSLITMAIFIAMLG